MTQDASTSTYEQLSALCAQMAAALESLRTNAALLYQNAEGCAVNHYGEDFQIHGLPGWLADCEKSIATAVAALTAYRTMSPDPVYAEAKNMLALLDGFHICPECERMTGPAWTHLREKHMGDCDIGNTINRARGEG